MSDKFNLPKENYHILGYITFIYLLCIIFASWDNRIDYGYYIVLRWLIMVFSAWSAFRIYLKTPQSRWLLIFPALAVLYNPIIKIPLDKDIWQIINILTLIIFIVFFIKTKK